MIPEHWIQERSLLFARQLEQSRDDYVWSPDEEPIRDEHFELLAATPVTPDELAQLADARGQYREGDTRGYVIAQEQQCTAYNCWMVRDADGGTRLLAERPAALTAAP
jgi:hypothetical protein